MCTGLHTRLAGTLILVGHVDGHVVAGYTSRGLRLSTFGNAKIYPPTRSPYSIKLVKKCIYTIKNKESVLAKNAR